MNDNFLLYEPNLIELINNQQIYDINVIGLYMTLLDMEHRNMELIEMGDKFLLNDEKQKAMVMLMKASNIIKLSADEKEIRSCTSLCEDANQKFKMCNEVNGAAECSLIYSLSMSRNDKKESSKII